MWMKFFFFACLVLVVASRAAPFSGEDEDDLSDSEYNKLMNLIRSMESEDVVERNQVRSIARDAETTDDLLRRSTGNHLAKRDALWTTTEVLDCVRRLRHFKGGSKLDTVTEMLNCYRRLKHSG